MLLAITSLVAVVVFLLFYIFVLAGDEQRVLEARLKAAGTVQNGCYIDEELAKPLRSRLTEPIIRTLGSIFLRITPQKTRALYEERIAAGGGFYGLSPDKFYVFWASIAVTSGCVFGIIARTFLKAPEGKMATFVIIGAIFGLLSVHLVLLQRVAARRNSIQKSLPEVLDLLCVSIEAGLSFDGALAKVAEKMKGPLIDELARTLQEIRVGVPRRQALRSFADRCKVEDVSVFVTALIQADQLGVSSSKVLQVQAENVREKRRQRVREASMKAPVKLVFPLVLFIFPALFIVILGPAFISIMKTLSK